jgi:hypothetical protein
MTSDPDKRDYTLVQDRKDLNGKLKDQLELYNYKYPEY